MAKVRNLSTKVGLFLLIFFSVFSFGFADTVYAWGYGDILAEALRGVKRVFGDGDLLTAFKIFLAFSLLLSSLSYFFGYNRDPLTLLKVYLIASLVYTIAFSVKTDVVIEDLRKPENNDIVQEVPWIVAKLMSFSSKFEKAVGQAFETAFAIPSELSYSEGGFFSGLGAIHVASQHVVIDPYLYRSINDYIVNCVIPDILDGTKDLNQLYTSQNLWAELGGTNPARTTKVYDSSNKSGELMDCLTAYSTISGRLQNYISNRGASLVANALGGFSLSKLDTLMGTATQYFFNVSFNAQNFLLQAIAMNHLNEAYQRWAAVNGISTDLFAYGLAKSERQIQNQMAISGILGSKYIPVIKGILVVTIASLMPLMVLLLITPLGKKTAFGIFTAVLWLAIWRIGDVIVNMIVNVKARELLLTASGGDGYTLLVKPIVDVSVLDYINMAGSFYWAIPTISLLVASGFSLYTFSTLAGKLGASVQGASSAGVGEMTTGNVSSGNVSINKRDFRDVSYFGVNTGISHIYTQDFVQRSSTHIASTNTFAGNMTIPGLGTGFVTGFVGEGGVMNIETFANPSVLGRNLVVSKEGEIQRGTFFAKNLGDFLKGLTKNSPIRSMVVNTLQRIGFRPEEVRNLQVNASDKGVSLSFIDDEGASVKVLIAKGGSFTYEVERAGGKLGGGETGVNTVQTPSLEVNISETFAEKYSQIKALQRVIHEAKNLSQKWSLLQKALFAEAVEKFVRGQLTANQVLNAFEEIKRLSLGGEGNIKGKLANLFSKYKIGSSLKLGGETFMQSKTGQTLSEGYSKGEGHSEAERIEKAFSKALEEALSRTESEISSLRFAIEQSEQQNKALQQSLMPLIANKIMEIYGYDPSEALRFIQENPEKVKEIAKRLMDDPKTRKKVLDALSSSYENPENVDVNTSHLSPVRNPVESKIREGINKQVKERVEEKIGNIEEQTKENTERLDNLLKVAGLGLLSSMLLPEIVNRLSGANVDEVIGELKERFKKKYGKEDEEKLEKFSKYLRKELEKTKNAEEAIDKAFQRYKEEILKRGGTIKDAMEEAEDLSKKILEVGKEAVRDNSKLGRFLKGIVSTGGRLAGAGAIAMMTPGPFDDLAFALAFVGMKLFEGGVNTQIVKNGETFYDIDKRILDRYGLEVSSNGLRVKDFTKFESLARELNLDPLTDYPGGILSPEAEKKVLNRLGARVLVDKDYYGID